MRRPSTPFCLGMNRVGRCGLTKEDIVDHSEARTRARHDRKLVLGVKEDEAEGCKDGGLQGHDQLGRDEAARPLLAVLSSGGRFAGRQLLSRPRHDLTRTNVCI